MLGEYLSDPDGTESEGAIFQVPGLGLLPVSTIFRQNKTRRLVRGTIREGYLSGVSVYGYEIHTGQTLEGADPETIPVTARGNVCGTYLHGLFDSGEAVDRLADLLARKKGLPQCTCHSQDRKLVSQQQLDLLADTCRSHMDLERIYGIIETWRSAETV